MKGKKKWLVLGILLMVSIVTYATVSQDRMEVRQAYVQKGELADFIDARGTIALEDDLKVYAENQGYVKAIFVEEGDCVSAGDLLASLDEELLDIQLEKIKNQYETAESRIEILKNEVLPSQVSQSCEELEQIRTLKEMAETEYAFAEKERDRMRVLLDNGAISQSDYDEVQLTYDSKKEAVKELEHREKIQMSDLQRLKVEVYGDQLAQEEMNARQLQLELDRLIKAKEKMAIRAPMEGVVMSKGCDMGQYVSEGTLVFEMGNIESGYAEAYILSDEASKLSVGQRVEITGEVVDDEVITGEISYVAPEAVEMVSSLGIKQRKNRVKVLFNNQQWQLKKGYEVDLCIITDQREDALFVPEDAVYQVDDVDHVFLVVNGRTEQQPVTTGIENDTYIEIVEGLQEGDRVVSELKNDLKSGVKVRTIN